MYDWGFKLFIYYIFKFIYIRLGYFVVEKAKIRYDWAFIPLEILKYGTAGVFFH